LDTFKKLVDHRHLFFLYDECVLITFSFIAGGGTAGAAGTSGPVRENSSGVAGAAVQSGSDN